MSQVQKQREQYNLLCTITQLQWLPNQGHSCYIYASTYFSSHSHWIILKEKKKSKNLYTILLSKDIPYTQVTDEN